MEMELVSSPFMVMLLKTKILDSNIPVRNFDFPVKAFSQCLRVKIEVFKRPENRNF